MYRFVALPDYVALRGKVLSFMESWQIKGTLLLANEGINGTVAGSREAIDALIDWLQQDERFQQLDCKFSVASELPFYRTKVKLKKEIVTMGVDGIDPRSVVGTYVKPKDWNALIADPEVVLVDTRNHYEVELGTFEGALNPNTESFREFPDYVRSHLDPATHKKVAMFCTGGIRCEKSTAYLKGQGFEEVYHLEGGILKYLEEVSPEDSKWRGSCFVFDNRVAVDHSLTESAYDLCHACRLPIREEDKLHPLYEAGVACHRCHGTHSAEQLQRFREREKQLSLARQRGQEHIGAEAVAAMEQNRARKAALKARQSDKSDE
jgi:UPF0176 protein